MKKDAAGSRWRDPRDVLDGILWWLITGGEWFQMPNPYNSPGPHPRRYATYGVCLARHRRWKKDGTLARILGELAKDPVLKTQLENAARLET
jgi:transposase